MTTFTQDRSSSFPSPRQGSASAAVERWHVTMSSGEVKELTSAELIEARRLGFVDDSTPVWKAGMAGWQPLGSVMPSPPPRTSMPPSAPPPAPLRSSVRPSAPAPALASSRGGTPGADLAEFARIARGPDKPRRPSSAPPKATASVAPSAPSTPPVAPSARTASPSSTPAEATVTQITYPAAPSSVSHLPPVMLSIPARAKPSRSRAAGVVWSLVASIAFVGAGFGLYRSGALLKLAEARHMDAQYRSIERRLLALPVLGKLGRAPEPGLASGDTALAARPPVLAAVVAAVPSVAPVAPAAAPAAVDAPATPPAAEAKQEPDEQVAAPAPTTVHGATARRAARVAAVRARARHTTAKAASAAPAEAAPAPAEAPSPPPADAPEPTAKQAKGRKSKGDAAPAPDSAAATSVSGVDFLKSAMEAAVQKKKPAADESTP